MEQQEKSGAETGQAVPIMRRKWFWYLTEFFSGVSVMAIELGASRLLAPYFSSSQIVWTVIIGTIMIAMALGNLWGGKLADKNPDPRRLYVRLLIVAIWTAAIPFAGKFVITGISLLLAMVVESQFLVWASFASCIVLFVFPLMLLGTVTPSLVKYTVDDLKENGATVGRLNALNTIGSILGTFLPTFVTIPAVGTAATFLIFAGILAALSITYFISCRNVKKRHVVLGGVTILVILGSAFASPKIGFAFWESNVVYEDESIYNYLQVKETDRSVILSTNVLAGVQSIRMKEARFTGMYYDYALAAPYMANLTEQSEAKALILGLGTGTYADMLTEYFPQLTVEGVEIDEKIVSLAKTYFSLPESVQAVVYDGRAYLQTGPARETMYDLIMVDAYQDITIPFQMSTLEFFTLVKEHLREGGVMVVNMNMRSNQEGAINDYLCDTISAVFPHVYTAQVRGGTNMELFASETDMLLENLTQQCKTLQLAGDVALAGMMETVREGLVPADTAGTRLLTDDKAPVELLGMRVIDEIIADQLTYYRTLLKEGGIAALLGN